MIYYIVLNEDYHEECDREGIKWSLPICNGDESWTPGGWMPRVKGKIQPASKFGIVMPYYSRVGLSLNPADEYYGPAAVGYPMYSADALLEYLNARIYVAGSNFPGGSVSDRNGVEVQGVRWCRTVQLWRPANWDASVARSFACDCAERVLPVVELLYPDVSALRQLITTCREFATGAATRAEVESALCEARRAPIFNSGYESYVEELRHMALDQGGQFWMPYYGFAWAAAQAVMATALQPAWQAAVEAAGLAQEGTLGDMTRVRGALLREAVKAWGPDYSFYAQGAPPHPTWGKEEESREAWEMMYSWTYRATEETRRQAERSWQADQLSWYLLRRTGPGQRSTSPDTERDKGGAGGNE